jgi:hypothetical protein
MASTVPSDVAHVLELVKTWPVDMRIALARRILETVEKSPLASGKASGRRGKPVEALIGIGAGSGPAPTDEDVRQWLAEHRMEKYGQ